MNTSAVVDSTASLGPDGLSAFSGDRLRVRRCFWNPCLFTRTSAHYELIA
jgi:hypothetical protein